MAKRPLANASDVQAQHPGVMLMDPRHPHNVNELFFHPSVIPVVVVDLRNQAVDEWVGHRNGGDLMQFQVIDGEGNVGSVWLSLEKMDRGLRLKLRASRRQEDSVKFIHVRTYPKGTDEPV